MNPLSNPLLGRPLNGKPRSAAHVKPQSESPNISSYSPALAIRGFVLWQ